MATTTKDTRKAARKTARKAAATPSLRRIRTHLLRLSRNRSDTGILRARNNLAALAPPCPNRQYSSFCRLLAEFDRLAAQRQLRQPTRIRRYSTALERLNDMADDLEAYSTARATPTDTPSNGQNPVQTP